MGGPGYVNNVKYKQFDNFYEVDIQWHGMIWKSAEHLYQSKKFKDENYQKEINKQHHPSAYYAMGQSREHTLIDDFEMKKVGLMYSANFKKFRQHEDLLKVLKSTEGPIEFYCSTPFWNKWNGKILEHLREKL